MMYIYSNTTGGLRKLNAEAHDIFLYRAVVYDNKAFLLLYHAVA